MPASRCEHPDASSLQPVAHQQPAAAAAGQRRQGLGRLARQLEAALADGRGHGAIDKPRSTSTGWLNNQAPEPCSRA